MGKKTLPPLRFVFCFFLLPHLQFNGKENEALKVVWGLSKGVVKKKERGRSHTEAGVDQQS